MATINKTPNTVKQTTGGHYRTMVHLDNIKNTNYKSYAVSKDPIQSKNKTYNRPSTITCTNYKFNLPSNAVVKKIVVHYRHSKRGANNSGQMQPSTYQYRPNLPAPTISITNTNLSKKGQAPAKTGSHKTLTFTGLWNASVVNSSNFGVKINYPTNANTQDGYLLIGYCYITLTYFTPNYGLTASSANTDTVYNGEDYHLKVKCSDSNTTGKSPTITITSPAGFTYAGPAGVPNGTITQISTHTFTWTPAMNTRANSQTVELIFNTNVSFSNQSTIYTGNFTAGIANTTTTSSHTATIYKERPTTETETDTDTPGYIDDDTTDEDTILKVIIGDTFDYHITLTSTEYQAVIDYWVSQGYSETDLEYMTVDTYFNSTWTSFTLADLDTDYSTTETYTANTVGIDSLSLYMADDHTTVWRSWDIMVIPTEASLTVPNYVSLQLTDEELNRLGDGYSYTLQSTVKLVTSETYVRDWYKNFRLGIFNNCIDANVTEYYEYNNTDETFNGYFIIPGSYDINGAYIRLQSDNSIVLNINDVDYTVTSTPRTINLFELYNIPVTYTKNGTDNVVITLTLYDSEDNQLYTKDYHINFNAEETTDLTEVTNDTTDYNNLTNAEIFNNAQYWSSTVSDVNSWESLTCDFTYEQDYPLYILITGDYPEGSPSNNDIKYLEPCIVEDDEFTERIHNGIYPTPIEELIMNDGSTGELSLEAYTKSDTLVFYDLPLEEQYGTNTDMAIRGIELVGNIEQSDQLVLYAKLKSPNGDSRERSIVVNDYNTTIDSDNTFSIGGNGDLWGFSTLDMTNMEDWEAELSISNVLNETDSTLNFGDIQLIFHIETVEKQDTKIYIEGEDVAYYGVFITDVTVPEGLETDTNYLSVDGTDTNDAYRQNIKEKTIEFEFEIGDNCSLTEATESLRQFTKLLVNERDEYNRPIPKRLEINHYPDVYWEYIMEEALDTDINISSYTCKAKLKIPAGTSYDSDVTTTANTGYVNGIASINPTVIVRPIDTLVTIKETMTDQQFSIGYTGGWENKILEIDCEDRIVWLRENEEDTDPINLNKYVDFNSDWFSIIGEYQFIGTGCNIRTVSLQERW